MKKLLLIIPFYNESSRISKQEYCEMFEKYSEIDFLVVDDGSSDNTLFILQQFSEAFSNVSILENGKNSGKAESIRQGVLQSNLKSYNYIGYLDADLATPINELHKLYNFAVQHSNFDIIMGSRIKLIGNDVERSLLRHYMGRIFASIISFFILKTPIYDTQCGAKIIHSSVASEIFKQAFISKWLFDVELLLRFKQKYQLETNVKEIPLEVWKEKAGTKIKLTDLFVLPYQLIKIYAKYV